MGVGGGPDGVHENNIGNGGKKRSYEVLVYKETLI
jgi:hypothetical protein